MVKKELERRLKEIHDKQHRAALEARTTRTGNEAAADKWLKKTGKPALDVIADVLREAGRGIQASAKWSITKKGLILSVAYPNEAAFSYGIELKTSLKGVAADVRINYKPTDDIPEKPILDWTQDDIQNVFRSGYANWQPNK
jgi:hypothetical protein